MATETPCVLVRKTFAEEEEVLAIQDYFPLYQYRAEVPKGSLVIGRYSCLPHYQELVQDLAILGSRLINSYEEHRYVADMDYYQDLADVTFPTWFRFQDVPARLRDHAFVVKGRTNSRKAEWNTKMFAESFKDAVRIGAELATDGLIGTQGVVIREYVPLETFELSITGLPHTNEWRLFYYKGQRLAYGYYWGNIEDWTPVKAAQLDFELVGVPFADEVALRIKDKVSFVVIDIAKTLEGRWVVVELNDGCQAGLNDTVDAVDLFSNLKRAITT